VHVQVEHDMRVTSGIQPNSTIVDRLIKGQVVCIAWKQVKVSKQGDKRVPLVDGRKTIGWITLQGQPPAAAAAAAAAEPPGDRMPLGEMLLTVVTVLRVRPIIDMHVRVAPDISSALIHSLSKGEWCHILADRTVRTVDGDMRVPVITNRTVGWVTQRMRAVGGGVLSGAVLLFPKPVVTLDHDEDPPTVVWSVAADKFVSRPPASRPASVTLAGPSVTRMQTVVEMFVREGVELSTVAMQWLSEGEPLDVIQSAATRNSVGDVRVPLANGRGWVTLHHHSHQRTLLRSIDLAIDVHTQLVQPFPTAAPLE
jgi:hypothetical protein